MELYMVVVDSNENLFYVLRSELDTRLAGKETHFVPCKK